MTKVNFFKRLTPIIGTSTGLLIATAVAFNTVADETGGAPSVAASDGHHPAGRVVSTVVLKLRKGPGTQYPQIGTLSENEPLTVLERSGERCTIEEKTDYWYRVARSDGTGGWAFGGFLTNAPRVEKNVSRVSVGGADETDDPQTAASDVRPVNETLLGELLTARGFQIPETFKALIIEIVTDEQGRAVYYPMDYHGTSRDRDNWWPASTVKLYAAVAALEKLGAMGFSPKAELTFGYGEDESRTLLAPFDVEAATPVTQPMSELIGQAVTESRNPEFDRLVEFVGAKRLNRYFLVPEKGIRDTVMMRAYSGRVKNPENGKTINRHSPPIRVHEGTRERQLKEQLNTETYDCERDGNCTTLSDLTEVLRRVMMHEHLPKSERYKLTENALALLRSALKRKTKGGVNDALKAEFKGRPIEIYHKGGYADRWFSDNIFLKINDTGEQWIIALVNRPGRESLNLAAAHVAAMIADGSLSTARQQHF